jgi:hypothetical protein
MATTTPKPAANETQSLNDRTRENIRLVKVIRGLSDEQLALLGAFTSRQVVADRVGGRTLLSLDDVDRFAQALGVNRDALVASRTQLMSWLDNQTEPDSPATVTPMKGRAKKAAAKPKPRKRAAG